ncbi:MAG: hypothetical protein O9256_03835 [Rhizobiaceae bacterium]|nr:hypothetical protein [Rhizobiaceae bacterium]MCZ8352021.1 hypothetical protein [Rhizobium sp.]
MPQAALADSTAVLSDHLTFSRALDELDDVHMMLTCLGESACHALTSEGLPDNYDTGLAELFRMSLDRLRSVRQAITDHKPKSEPVEQPRRAVFERKHLPDDPWVKFKLFWRVIEVIKAVRQENGEPVYDRDEDWPEPLRTTVMNLAESYVAKVAEKVEDWNDALEVGSYLPWVETVIRRELTNLKPTAAPTKLREQFILNAVQDGFSTADIAQALGMSRLAVDRAIYKIKREPSADAEAQAS